LDTANYRFRVLKPLAEKLEISKLNFQILRRTTATQAQKMGSVKDIQAHLRHARADTTANEYMQELPQSVVKMVAAVYEMLLKGGPSEGRKEAHSEAEVARLLPNATNGSETISLNC
jgi:integrase